MRLYLGTSLLVAALANEEATERVREWLSGHISDKLLSSEWVVTEFSAAMAMKVRLRYIDPAQHSEILARFARMHGRNMASVPISAADFRTAARFADNSATKLRAGDALHMAICRSADARLCTLDRTLAAAGALCGVDTLLL